MNDDTERWIEVLSGKADPRPDNPDDLEAARIRKSVQDNIASTTDDLRVRKLKHRIFDDKGQEVPGAGIARYSIAASVILLVVAGLGYVAYDREPGPLVHEPSSISKAENPTETLPEPIRRDDIISNLTSLGVAINVIEGPDERGYIVSFNLTAQQLSSLDSQLIEEYELKAGSNKILIAN
jgi:hypothetical protein